MLPKKLSKTDEIVNFYTKEIDRLQALIHKLKTENSVIMRTAVKQTEKNKFLEDENKRLKKNLESKDL